MKKNNLTLVIFLLIGLLAGTIVSQLLLPFESVSFLTKSAAFSWEPKADLQLIKYDFKIQVKLNLTSLLGLAAAFWIYRKL